MSVHTSCWNGRYHAGESQRYVKKGVLCIGKGFGSFPLFVGREGSPRGTSSFRAFAFVLAWLSLNLVTDCFTPLITSCLLPRTQSSLCSSTFYHESSSPPPWTIKVPHNSNQISFAKQFPNETFCYFVGEDVTLGHDLANVLRTRLHSPSWQRLSWPKSKVFLMLVMAPSYPRWPKMVFATLPYVQLCSAIIFAITASYPISICLKIVHASFLVQPRVFMMLQWLHHIPCNQKYFVLQLLLSVWLW